MIEQRNLAVHSFIHFLHEYDYSTYTSNYFSLLFRSLKMNNNKDKYEFIRKKTRKIFSQIIIVAKPEESDLFMKGQ